MWTHSERLLQINPQAQVTWHPIGDFGTEVLQVDDFLTNPSGLREFALKLAYYMPTADDYYPGFRSFVTLPGSNELLNWLGDIILSRLFPSVARPPEIVLQGGVASLFSIKTLSADRVPPNFHDQHSDSNCWMASVVHLGQDDNARGTAFWEHKPSGLQHWCRADPVMSRRLEANLGLRLSDQLNGCFRRSVPVYEASDIQRLFAKKATRVPFSAHEDDDWRLLSFVPAKFNRLVAYPAWQLHSIVDGTVTEMLTVENMRLTMNPFLNYPFARGSIRSPYPAEMYRRVEGLSVVR